MTAIAETPTAASGPSDSPGSPGSLTVRAKAAEHLVHGVVADVLPGDTDPDVEIVSLDDEGIELRSTITLEYASEPLTATLAHLRRDIAFEVARQLGRPVRRVDLVVGSFADERPAPVRRVV